MTAAKQDRSHYAPRERMAPDGGVMHPPIPKIPSLAPLVVWLAVADIATMFGVSKMTVYRLIHTGELKAVRVGKQFRVQERHALKFLRDHPAANLVDPDLV